MEKLYDNGGGGGGGGMTAKNGNGQEVVVSSNDSLQQQQAQQQQLVGPAVSSSSQSQQSPPSTLQVKTQLSLQEDNDTKNIVGSSSSNDTSTSTSSDAAAAAAAAAASAEDAGAAATTTVGVPLNIHTFFLETCGISIHDMVESAQRVWRDYQIPIIVATCALITSPPGRRLLQNIMTIAVLFALRLVAWASGIALGLGWAIHVYEQLDAWHAKQQQAEQELAEVQGEEWTDGGHGGHAAGTGSSILTRRRSIISDTQSLGGGGGGGATNRVRLNTGSGNSYKTVRSIVGTSSGMTTSSIAGGTGGGTIGNMGPRTVSVSCLLLEDEQTYASLMLVAGYVVPSKILRGQVLRAEDDFWKRGLQYPFTNSKSSSSSLDDNNSSSSDKESSLTQQQKLPTSRALRIMQDYWPTLPTVVNEQLALWMEHILRDYVAAWYSRADLSICYKPAVVPTATSAATAATASAAQLQLQQQNLQNAQEAEEEFHRRVLYSTARHRNVPFIDHLYESMAIIFGNLATRVEHVNVLQVVLLKWTRILAHTFKVYRHLRRQVRIKQMTHNHNSNNSNNNNNNNSNQNRKPAQTPNIGRVRRRSTVQAQPQPPSSLSLLSAPSESSSSSSPVVVMATGRSNTGGYSVLTTSSTTATSKSPSSHYSAAANAAASFASGAFDSATASLSAAAASTLAAAVSVSTSTTGVAASSTVTSSSASAARGGGGGAGGADFRSESTTTSTRESSTRERPLMVESSYKVSEISMTKEFLFCGKLHRAITFGLDVPALLFADATGRECGIPKSNYDKDDKSEDDPLNAAQRVPMNAENKNNNNNSSVMIEDAVLEARLFGNSDGSAPSSILQECELDYNRVLAHRMVRALLPRNDFGCTIVSSLVTEIMAGCVLSPIMSCFGPDYINGWIIKGLSSSPTSSSSSSSPTSTTTLSENGKEKKQQELDAKTTQAVATGNANSNSSNNSKDMLRGWDKTSIIKEDDDDVLEKQSIERNLTSSIKIASPEISPRDGNQQSDSSDNINSFKQQQQSVQLALSSPFAEKLDAVDEQMSPASLPDDDELGPNSSTHDQKQQPQDEESSSLSVPPLSETPNKAGDSLLTQLAMALIDLQRFLDFEEYRDARESNREFRVDWDDDGCRGAVLQLVLVIEAALTHGRCTYKQGKNKDNDQDDDDDNDDDSGRDEDDGEQNNGDQDDVDGLIESEAILDDVEVTLPEYESTTLSQILMELTSDIEAFEERVATENTLAAQGGKEQQDTRNDQRLAEPYKPTSTEQSTLRTLIAAWLHTGQIYRTVTVLVQAHATILAPYYNQKAFLRSHVNAAGFVRQLKALNGVEVLVDTMAVLASPRLEEILNDEQLPTLLARSSQRPSVNTGRRQPPSNSDALSPLNNQLATQQYMPNTTTPRHSDFHRNEAFAASLRSERERRSMSWYAQFDDDFDDGSGGGVPIVCHVKGGSEEDTMWHRELHHLARIFYSGTNLIAVRDAARRKSSSEADAITGDVKQTVDTSELSLLTVETACPRRRIEVPDDDSSFLLRAQPRPLNAMGVHRDQRNHDHSFKCFAATYEEPTLPRGSDQLASGRYVRRCLVRYYPIDRTASVLLQNNDVRKLDQRKGQTSSNSPVPETITVGQQQTRPTPFLTSEFLRERHLCQRWVPKGTMRTQSILASSVMEPTDFTAQPRAGKALDFLYRLNFFEKPMILLGDKHFTVHDSSSLGSHRADASSMEISDAALSATLCIIGETEGSSNRNPGTESRQVEMGPDGAPIIWMKFTSRKQDNDHVEVKPYRISFVRAALLVTAARQEAQLQSLVRCVRAGSAKSATKALTDARLKPTLRLLEYAGHRSREKQSLLLRDLKLGVNHIDREQLRRNGLISPRYPTTIKELFVSVEDSLQAEEVRDAGLYGATGTVYKIHCAVMVELIADEDEMEYDSCYRTERGELAAIYREEWVVYRSFKEFQALHKHLKNQVSTSESSGTAVSRLSASLNASGVTHGRRQKRSSLIPSLSQASKIGALGITKKSQERRKEHLDEYLGYLLAPGHLLNRSPELLLFVGAFYPLPSEVRIGRGGPVSGIPDPLGRTQMARTAIQQTIRERAPSSDRDNATNAATGTPHSRGSMLFSSQASTGDGLEGEEDVDEDMENSRKAKRKLDMLPAIRNKIDKVPLSQVRNRVFELLRYQFGFENASFVRNRMLATLKTASFAVTSASEFRRTLYNLHLEHLSAASIAGWIHFGLDMLWPNGVFFQSSPPLTALQLVAEAEKAKTVLHESFPDALRTILGQDLTKDGLDIFHEMLQNRVVVKSMSYMLFDVLWLEIFPEIGDLLQGGAALDMDNNN